jgi:hypothetical protein
MDKNLKGEEGVAGGGELQQVEESRLRFVGRAWVPGWVARSRLVRGGAALKLSCRLRESPRRLIAQRAGSTFRAGLRRATRLP